MQYWLKHVSYRIAVIFEGRDAVAKGGVIKCIAELLNPCECDLAGCKAGFRKV